jgi:hypothetical protein
VLSQRSSVLSRRVVKMLSHVITSVIKKSACAITWVVKRTSRVVTWVITLLLGLSQGLLWCCHNGRQIVRKWKIHQLSLIVVSCRQFVMPKSSTWQSCLSCRVIRHSFWGPQTVTTLEPVMHFPYRTRLVPNSWHMSDGVIPTKKEVRSHTTLNHFMVWVSATPRCDSEKIIKQAYDLFLGPCPQKSQNCSRFLNKKSKYDGNHLASIEHHQVCKNL